MTNYMSMLEEREVSAKEDIVQFKEDIMVEVLAGKEQEQAIPQILLQVVEERQIFVLFLALGIIKPLYYRD